MHADIDHDADAHEVQSGPRSVLLLLDAVSCGAQEMERFVSQLLSGASGSIPESGAIVTPVALRGWVDCARWRTIVVSDIERVAAAFGVFALPAIVLAGAVEETLEQIDAIMRRQGPTDTGRVSGALSSADLR